MKVILVNGSPHKEKCTNRALQEVASQLEKNGIETEMVWLGTKPMQDCISCGNCGKTGTCVFEDQVNEVSALLDEADGMVIGSPVYYGGANGRICSFMDRLCFSAGAKLDGKVCAGVVSCRRGGSTASYERLNMFFGMNNCIVPASQYWNQVHGSTIEQVEQDVEGLQTMRTLADNIAWTIKAQHALAEAGEGKPEREAHAFTNFIR